MSREVQSSTRCARDEGWGLVSHKLRKLLVMVQMLEWCVKCALGSSDVRVTSALHGESSKPVPEQRGAAHCQACRRWLRSCGPRVQATT